MRGRAKQVAITEAQAEVYAYIIKHIEEFGYQPSFGEIAERFGVSTKAIRDRITQLVSKGYIELPPKHSDRCLKLRFVKFAAQLDEPSK